MKIGNSLTIRPGLRYEQETLSGTIVQGFTLKNNWGVNFGSTLGQLGVTYDDRTARGGPAVRQNPYFVPWINISGDDRKPLVL